MVEPATGVVITWEVMNRFRLFRDDRDFRRHVDAESGRSVLDAEQDMAEATEGRGWARDMVVRLCLDAIGRRSRTTACATACGRTTSPPLTTASKSGSRATVPSGAACTWTFGDGDPKPRTLNAACSEAGARSRPRYGRPTMAIVDIAVPGEPIRRATGEIAVRDLLIAGLGDFVASGDGNPDRPVALADEGFCFRRFDVPCGCEYFRPSRVGFKGVRACDSGSVETDRDEWALLSARWMGGACHRSLYGHQLRAALALAVESPHMAVTFLPLACTGATIDTGLLAGQRSREINCGSGTACPRTIAGPGGAASRPHRPRATHPARPQPRSHVPDHRRQRHQLPRSRRRHHHRVPPANAGCFAARHHLDRRGLAGDAGAEAARRLRQAARRAAPARRQLRARRLRVLRQSRARLPTAVPAPAAAQGFDINPTFNVGADRLSRVTSFVQQKFLPALKEIATCKASGACASPSERMTFVDAHQTAFAEHGFCAKADTDPPFDRECFLTDGTSFSESLVDGAQPAARLRRGDERIPRLRAPRALDQDRQ